MRRGTEMIAFIAVMSVMAGARAETPPLRVCAATDNFPFSDRQGSGFENKLAKLVAEKLGTSVDYTWWPARENFIDKTLKKGDCDVLMGVPADFDQVETTRAYYRSSYVFVSRKDAHLDVRSLKDPRLEKLEIGVYLLGSDQTPPALVLAKEGLNDRVRGFMTFYDGRGSTHTPGLIQALDRREIDVAAVWGPLVGYYAHEAGARLTVTPIVDGEDFPPLVFRYDIAMGVRKGDHQLRAKLDKVIDANGRAIRHLLAGYGVPLLPIGTDRSAATTTGD